MENCASLLNELETSAEKLKRSMQNMLDETIEKMTANVEKKVCISSFAKHTLYIYICASSDRPIHTSKKLLTERLTTIGGVTLDSTVAANVSLLTFRQDQTLLDSNDNV